MNIIVKWVQVSFIDPPLANQLLIVSLTPQNLERGVLWFQKNSAAVKRARNTNLWWRKNSCLIERDLILKPSAFVRVLMDLGYERVPAVRGRGLFAVRGGLIELWPINEDTPYLIEFMGNTVSDIRIRPAISQTVEPRARLTADINTLPAGSYVVHEDHGIGIFRGVQNSTYKTEDTHYCIVEYAPPSLGRTPDYLYVPLSGKDRLTPYIGFETPHIHRLGGTVWDATKRKAREDTARFARELLELYTARTSAVRPPCAGDPAFEDALRTSFPYQETTGQQTAESEISSDLGRPYPMDRILCGDVGFGKTEVALRAALKVISSGRQVVLIAPTTILAAQHAHTFAERLRALPVSVRLLSRLAAPKEARAILHGIKNGTIDCAIGTHRLLSSDVQFKNLGLVIIDEEQRFGVRHKEHFKKFQAEVDLLSLSATPIPRTLHLALAKLRDLSILQTPPADRLAVATHVLPYSKKIICEAIAQELHRDGQVYVLHNRIHTIGTAARRLACLFPAHRRPAIGIMHGRMKEKEIMNVMDEFRHKKLQVLVATTIIENGLDISSANTLIVEDAIRLGLAEAHQLRGRIGRGALQAYAYFFYRPRRLSEHAAQRLAALQSYAGLGAGYTIALRDLEIRGAGNVLGKEQSGAINKVGLNLYYQMLSEAIEQKKNSVS